MQIPEHIVPLRVYEVQGVIGHYYMVFFPTNWSLVWFPLTETYGVYDHHAKVNFDRIHTFATESKEIQVLMGMRRHIKDLLEQKRTHKIR
jgi:hypothetical protein